MATQTELRQRITNQIIDALKTGNLPPWRKPWASDRNAGFPANVVSRRSYSGINPLLLLLSAEKHTFRTKWWGTYRQWEQLGGNVMRRPENVEPGQWGTSIVLWKPVEKIETDPDTGEESTKKFGFLKQFHVFNLDQVEGERLDYLRVTNAVVEHGFVDYEPADRAIAATGADIRYGGSDAFYRRPNSDEGDFIQLPHQGAFSAKRVLRHGAARIDALVGMSAGMGRQLCRGRTAGRNRRLLRPGGIGSAAERRSDEPSRLSGGLAGSTGA